MTHPIEKWYSGKALTVIQTYVLPMLAEAERLGYWPKGASRKVKAALNKQNVAAKWARKQPGARYDTPLWEVLHAMSFGSFSHAPRTLFELSLKSGSGAASIPDTARGWAADFAPVAELVKLLDSRRPVPVVVCKTLSPTVLANVGRGMGVDLTSIEFPVIEYVWVKQIHEKTGAEYEISVPVIRWPAGTRHCTSRYSSGHQCHACGHRIYNPFNWIPLLAQTAAGPVSLWVGSDCARKLFGCEVSGEADWTSARGEVTSG